MSQLEVDKVIPQSGTTLTLGDSADTITIPSGATIDASGATLTLPTTIEVDTIEPQSGTSLTLGASGDTITIPSGATITNSGTATGFGKVLQVVNATFNTNVTSSSSTFADSGLSASITPSSASNKVLIFANLNGIYKTTNNTGISLKLVRGVTDIHNIESIGAYTNDNGNVGVGSSSTSYLDTPSTTSSTTYKITFNSFNNNGTVNINANSVAGGTVSTMTLMEIQA
jgi:hypothetical protein